MIEAVNSVIANASLARAAVAGTDASARPEVSRQEIQVPQAPYISPYISVDNNYNEAVIQIRDSETGDVLTQFPSESRLQARAQEQAIAQQPVSQQTPQSGAPTQATQQADVAFTAQSLSASVELPTPSVGVAQAQIASAALTTGAQSGQVFSGAVNVTA